MGVSFGYFILTPFMVNFYFSYKLSDLIEIKPSFSDYLENLTYTTVGVGILFQLPLLIYVLAKVGFITAAFLRKFRTPSYRHPRRPKPPHPKQPHPQARPPPIRPRPRSRRRWTRHEVPWRRRARTGSFRHLLKRARSRGAVVAAGAPPLPPARRVRAPTSPPDQAGGHRADIGADRGAVARSRRAARAVPLVWSPGGPGLTIDCWSAHRLDVPPGVAIER